MKPIEEQFADWESNVFGFGYGSGEEHTLLALLGFMKCIPAEGPYDYREIERALSPTVAWLMINILCHANIIEYGSSPRFGWLTPEGVSLRRFLSDHTESELLEILGREHDRVVCYPDACNCGERGYEEGRVCHNEFWAGHHTETV